MSIQSILYRKGGEVETISSNASIKRAAEQLRERNVTALVVKDGESILGLISEHDIVNALARHGDAIATKTVGDITARNVLTAAPEDGLKRTMGLMARHHSGHLLVLRDRKLAGIVSVGDVLKQRLEDLETEKEFVSRGAHRNSLNITSGRELSHV